MKRGRDLPGVCAVESIDMANVLLVLSQNGSGGSGGTSLLQYYDPVQEEERVFECKTCYKQFSSFQALGGHRASHKKPKLISSDAECNNSESGSLLAKRKVHECSICGLEFSVGQALGGHMRRHRSVNENFRFEDINRGVVKDGAKSDFLLDLNSPPTMSTEELGCRRDDVEVVTLTFL